LFVFALIRVFVRHVVLLHLLQDNIFGAAKFQVSFNPQSG